MKSKAQIAIEFLIVFAFILLVFLFLFSLITQQRAVIQNTQTYSQLQLVAQNLALQITRAGLAGNGYSAQIPLLTTVGVTPYNLSITKSGTIIVTSTTAQQAVRTTAFSSARGISSNPAYLSSGSNTVYNIPISNGSVSIQNSFGTVCIDYQCPTVTNITSSVSISSQVVSVANLNGQSSSISIPNSNSINFERTNPFSISLWIKSNAIGTSGILEKFNYGTTTGYYIRFDPSKLYFVIASSSGGDSMTALYNKELRDGQWHNLIFTYDGSSSSAGMAIYVDGNSVSPTLGGSVTTSIQASNPLSFGTFTYSGGSYLSGQLSNVQIYNTMLSSNQAMSLYQAGINSGAISSNIVGLWPLNGNADDYSGNGNNGAASGIIFTTAAQIFAKVTNPLGLPAINTLVGFATTLGNFTNGFGYPGQAVSTYTNSNGMAAVFLNQQWNNGQALVKATVLSGNFLPQSNLVAWYPLNLGQGGTAYDLSGNKNNGAFSGQPSWNLPNYLANFSGPTPLPSGYLQSISIQGQSPLKTTPTSSITLTAWINTSQYSSQPAMVIGEGSSSSWNFLIKLCQNSGAIGFYSSGIGGWFCSNSPVPLSKWTFISVTWDGSTVKFYQNGHQDGQVSASGTIPAATMPWFIGGRPDGYPFYGQIANVQIYSNALSLSQLQQLYQGGLSGSPISNSGLDAWWPLNGDANDYSGNINDGVIYNRLNFVPSSQAISSKQITSGNLGRVLAANFLSSNSIPIPSANILNPTNAISISAWIYPAESQIKVIAAKNNIPSGAGIDYELLMYNQNLHFDLAKGGSTTVLSSNIIIPLNSWHYVTGTWDGSTMKIYIDGTQDSNTISLSNNIDTSQNALTIGAYWNGGYPFNGLISNVQVYNFSLSPAQVLQSYLSGVGGTPPSGTQPVGWWPLNGNANDNSNFGHNGTSANVIYKNTVGYAPFLLYGANYSGINLNGQNSYASLNGLPVLSGSSVSVVAWVNEPASHMGEIMRTSNSVSPSLGTLLRDEGNGNYQWHVASATNAINIQAPIPSFNSWHFVAGTYDGTTSNIYVDGVPMNSLATSLQLVQTNSIGIGAWSTSTPPSEFFNGSISNLQIYSTALSASQVQQLYNAQLPPSASTTVPLSWSP